MIVEMKIEKAEIKIEKTEINKKSRMYKITWTEPSLHSLRHLSQK